MRLIYLLSLSALVGCHTSSEGATDRLCRACSTDADCAGNPCYADITGARFCGRPCAGGCPASYSCQPLAGSSGKVVDTCFPDSYACPTGAPVGGNGDDMALAPPVVARDMAQVPCTRPSGGTVGIGSAGGSVDRLYFGYTGDTRGPSNASAYPASVQATINSIYSRMAANGVEFAVDGGDHMEAGSAAAAQGNMASYLSAARLLGKPVFMTMGNHECLAAYPPDSGCGYAGAATADYKYAAYLSALKDLTGVTSPYYRFDIMTQAGKAVFLVVADDAWNQDEQSWLEAQLADADKTAKYTFVSKHHPDGNADQPYFPQIYNTVLSHKYTLFLTGHTHEYKHSGANPRAVVMGLGGAPLDAPNSQMYWGYLTVTQCPDDRVQVDVYDEGTGNVTDTFAVLPQ